MLVTPTAAHAAKLSDTRKQLDDRSRPCATRFRRSRTASARPIRSMSHCPTSSYGELFGPFRSHVAAVKHLIFEPDGAMLRLPANLLVMDQASVDSYNERPKRAMLRVRLPRHQLARPRPRHQHVGQPALLRPASKRAAVGRDEGIPRLRREAPPSAAEANLVPAAADRDCTLPMSSWTHPISAKELEIASSILKPYDANWVK